MPRAETDKPIHRLHDVDLVEVQGTQGTLVLPLPQSVVYINESEELVYVFLT